MKKLQCLETKFLFPVLPVALLYSVIQMFNNRSNDSAGSAPALPGIISRLPVPAIILAAILTILIIQHILKQLRKQCFMHTIYLDGRKQSIGAVS